VWIRTTLAGLAFACSADTEADTDGACVPGASAMCWCDGETPGVQECQPDMTFAGCICDGAASGGDSTGAASSGDVASGDASAGSNTASGDETGLSEPSTTTVGQDETVGADTGDPVPVDCTDELFSLWQACRSLAGLNNPSDCGPCTGGNGCENAACNIDCAEQGNPAYEADVAACDVDYPQCAGILDQPVDPYFACTQECAAALNECLASFAPECEPMSTGSCYTDGYSPCVAGC